MRDAFPSAVCVDNEVWSGLKITITEINGHKGLELVVYDGPQRNFFNKYPHLRIPTKKKVTETALALVEEFLSKQA